MFFKAMTTKDVLTENGMPTNSTSSNRVLDMFFKMGGSRGMTEGEILRMFYNALNENPLLATKALFYNRDVRGGQGERRSFRIMFNYLCSVRPTIAIKNMALVPEYGRWDDLFSAFGTPAEASALDLILFGLKSGDALCAKWMPRENKSNSRLASRLMEAFGLTPRQYRKLIAGNTHVVETLMCNMEWSKINYNHVPSKAINNYRDAFSRHDTTRWYAWLASLSDNKSGNAVHADAIFPHDIVKGYYNNRSINTLLEEQWKALPNYVPQGRMILPVCDVSGSMTADDALMICMSLGIYLSERNTGPFKDGFITFSTRPQLQILTGNLRQRISQLSTANWTMNTNLEAVFDLILRTSLRNGVKAEEMPSDILILSDMQFDQCVENHGASAMDMIRRKYVECGYAVPNVIFWNLRTSRGVPVKFDENGTALVSGFSPSIMKSLLGGSITPMAMMLNVLESERYAKVMI